MSDDRVVALLDELVAWARFANRDGIVATWSRVLSDEKHLRAYEITDGTRTQREVAEQSGLSQPTVSGLWQKWRRLGLVREGSGVNVRHIARPTDLGVAVPSASSGGGPSKAQTSRTEEG